MEVVEKTNFIAANDDNLFKTIPVSVIMFWYVFYIGHRWAK